MASFMATLDALRVAFHIDANALPADAIAELERRRCSRLQAGGGGHAQAARRSRRSPRRRRIRAI